MKVWLVQAEAKLCDKEANAGKILSYMDQAIEAKADLVVFAETFLTGYMCGHKFFGLAESIPGPSTMDIMEKAKKGIYVLFGMPEVKDGMIYNSAPLFGPEGLVGIYRKLYLANAILPTVLCNESVFFKPGSDIVTFDTDFGKLGIQICNDIWFPEIPRTQAVEGALFFLNINVATFGPKGYDLPPLFQFMARARAVENAGWFGLVNQVGVQEGARFGGGTCLIDNAGRIVKSASMGEDAHEEVVDFEIDLSKVLKARLATTMVRDTRPEILQRAAEIIASQGYED